MKRVITLAIALVVLLACVGTVSANLVTNGGFESPVAGYPWTTLYAGNGLTGWTISPDSGSIDLDHGGWQSHSGAQSIDLAGDRPATISQTINTEVGKTYDLTFWLAGNSYTSDPKSVNVYWDGAKVDSPVTFDVAGKDIFKTDGSYNGWTKITLSGLKATKTTTEIAFEQIPSSENLACGVMLDDISVELAGNPPTPTPEFPSTAIPAAMLVGFMGIVLYVQKSKKY